MAEQKVITLSSSAAFYKHVNELEDELVEIGYMVIVPHSAQKMRKTGNYDVSQNKTWYKNPSDFKRKTALMDQHFKEVEKADAILVVNDEKHGQPGYIGPNVLMEMAVAYYLKKPIFVLNEVEKVSSVPKGSNVYEEVAAMKCQILNGDLSRIKL